MSRPVRVITLDRRLAHCAVCQKEVTVGDGGYVLPMYEGTVDFRSKFHAHVCEDCYASNLQAAGREAAETLEGPPDS